MTTRYNKEDITRNQLNKNIMKSVFFRLDYQGVIDAEDVLKKFNEEFPNKFKKLITTYQNQVDFNLTNIDEISETLSIPVKELVRQEIYQFSKNTFGKDEAILTISKYFSTFVVNCKDYVSIDEYLDFFSNFADFLIEICDYLEIRRIGLRKISGKIYRNPNEIFHDFEKKYYNFDFDQPYKSIRNQYLDFLKKEDDPITVNYLRSFKQGYLFDQETNENVPASEVQLDIDGYISDDYLLKQDLKKGLVKSLFASINNEHLFKIFKMSVTEDFLNEHIR